MKEPAALYCTRHVGTFTMFSFWSPEKYICWGMTVQKLAAGGSAALYCGFVSKVRPRLLWDGTATVCVCLILRPKINKQDRWMRRYFCFLCPRLYLNRSLSYKKNSEESWSSEFSWLTDDVRVYISGCDYKHVCCLRMLGKADTWCCYAIFFKKISHFICKLGKTSNKAHCS